jgi:hypothetical protein
MRRLVIVICVAATAGMGGCGGRTPSDEEQVRDVLATFARSVEKRDFQRLCEDVFAPKLLTGLRSIGLPCEVALRNSFGEVQDPRLTVGRVSITGDKATAEVRTSARGQSPSSDTLELARVDGSWKVSALAGSKAPAVTATPAG